MRAPTRPKRSRSSSCTTNWPCCTAQPHGADELDRPSRDRRPRSNAPGSSPLGPAAHPRPRSCPGADKLIAHCWTTRNRPTCHPRRWPPYSLTPRPSPGLPHTTLVDATTWSPLEHRPSRRGPRSGVPALARAGTGGLDQPTRCGCITWCNLRESAVPELTPATGACNRLSGDGVGPPRPRRSAAAQRDAVARTTLAGRDDVAPAGSGWPHRLYQYWDVLFFALPPVLLLAAARCSSV